MLDELRARFRDRFIAAARVRLERVRRLAGESDLHSVAGELHALAGEAALLQFSECAQLAREGADLARSGEARRCKSVVDSLEKAVDAVAA
jgi:HPt (histidine-containing phosphotransfer) domain-containing protein